VLALGLLDWHAIGDPGKRDVGLGAAPVLTLWLPNAIFG
jgi:hypothetical protein